VLEFVPESLHLARGDLRRWGRRWLRRRGLWRRCRVGLCGRAASGRAGLGGLVLDRLSIGRDALARTAKYTAQRKAVSIALLGNAARILPALAEHFKIETLAGGAYNYPSCKVPVFSATLMPGLIRSQERAKRITGSQFMKDIHAHIEKAGGSVKILAPAKEVDEEPKGKNKRMALEAAKGPKPKAAKPKAEAAEGEEPKAEASKGEPKAE